MYRIIDERGSGKTGRLFLLAKENDAVIACSNPYAMRVKAERYGIVGIDFIHYKDLLEQKDSITADVYIDELDSFLHCITPKIGGYTVSKED